MKRSGFAALLAIAALTLFASAPAAASPPLAFEHPLNLALAPPCAIGVEIVATVQVVAPVNAFESSISRSAEQVEVVALETNASVPGVKRTGAAVTILAVDDEHPSSAPKLPPLRALRT